MRVEPKRSFVERAALGLGLLRDPKKPEAGPERLVPGSGLVDYPPPERWDDWTEYEARGWTRRQKKSYQIVPTVCFNCEAACGLLSYVDKESGEVRKFEGHPLHPGSRGKNCAKGPATINQVKDPHRILYPQKRVGPRGSGRWERVSWEEALADIGGRIRKAIVEDRKDEVMYHVGRPGHEHQHMERIFRAWGVDAHNSHTNVCSSGGRFGYQLWGGFDRPSPDYANAKAILLISAHLESGHYFNPHAQRIIEGKMKGAKLIVMDPRLSNSAAMADHWLPTRPGSEPTVLLAMAKIILQEGLYDAAFLRDWTNWEQYLEHLHPNGERSFAAFLEALKSDYAHYTPEHAEKESGVPAERIVAAARAIGEAGNAVAAHNWRAAAAGNLGGWQVSRCLVFLNVLTGSWGRKGGTSPNGWNKWLPTYWDEAPPQDVWSKLLYPDEYPLAQYEMSILLPYFLMEGRGKLEVYFSRVLNPVWTFPDGFAWMEALQDEEAIGCHVALTPTWNETAYFADYVLPLGHGPERHDLMSQETHSGKWLSFRQPVLREAARRRGETINRTHEANPGEVWEDDEFWIDLSWSIDPDGDLGIRRHFESPYTPGERLTVDEYYRWLFENAVPGLPEKAAEEGLSPLEYMRRYAAFEVQNEVYERNARELSEEELEGTRVEPDGTVTTERSRTGGVVRANRVVPHVGVHVDGKAREGFPTLSGKLEIWSPTMDAWGWPEHAAPGSGVKSHVHPDELEEGQLVLNATFRLPTLIHTRSGNSKWLNEISNKNPLWVHPKDAEARNIQTGDLVRVTTEIGFSVNHAWVTEGIAPGVVACSHHLGRWRRKQDAADRWTNSLVDITRDDGGGWRLRQVEPPGPYESSDPDTSRIFWSDGGVHQNLTFPVHPDPISGMHCWHNAVYVEGAGPEDRYGDVFVDTAKSREVYRRWLSMTRPGPQEDGLRRPEVFDRPYRPVREAYYEGKG